VDPVALSARLWGDVWYSGESGKFQRTPPSSATPRSFIAFVLEPLYKVYSVCLGESGEAVRDLATSLGLSERQVPKAALAGNARALLKCVLGAWLGGCAGVVSGLLTHTPSPLGAGPGTARRLYQGDAVSPEVEGMSTCNPQGVLMVNCVKLVPDALGKSFLALGKVLSGTLRVGQKVKVLGESYSAEESEDMQLATVRGVHLGQGRYTLKLEAAPPGALVLIEGLGDAMVKGATVTSAGEESMDVGIFAPVAFNTSACVNVSVEPLNPSELPKVLGGLRAILKSYPLARTRVEESGEHVLIGTGELAMDCMLRDLREMYAKVEVKVADPVVSFSETCAEQSSLQCFALTPNKKNKFTMLAEPLDKGELWGKATQLSTV
jgi:U5 small nuclear ribonucleoprotein component